MSVFKMLKAHSRHCFLGIFENQMGKQTVPQKYLVFYFNAVNDV